MNSDRDDAIAGFLKRSGWGTARLDPLVADASTRRYIRLHKDGRTAMLMDQPQAAEAPAAPAGATPEQRHALGYNAIARLAGADCGRFIAAANYLRARGLSAPEIYSYDVGEGLVLIEDLGDRLYADTLNKGGDENGLYKAAAEVLSQLHAERAPTVLPPDKPLHTYDETALLAEVDLMTEWFAPVALGRTLAADEIEEHRALWRAVLRDAVGASSVFVHRDYHAQNLMWLEDRSGAARVGLIDFQDAVAGTTAYDLISLVEDARRDVPAEIAELATGHYLETMKAQGTPRDEQAFRSEMAVMAAQRNAKIAGIFARLSKRDGKPRYLGYLPRVWGYLNRDLSHPDLSNLKHWYDRVIPMESRGTPPRVEGEAA
jgi:aminoglycoside/choline kinase family phosphotransferase